MAMAPAPDMAGFDDTQRATLLNLFALNTQQERAQTTLQFVTLIARMDASDVTIQGILE